MIDRDTIEADSQQSAEVPSPDDRRWLENIQRAQAQRAHDRNAENFDTANNAAIKCGEETRKAALLINGGSSVAMLTFIGAMASKDQLAAQQLALLAKPLYWFASGLVAAVLCSGFAFLANSANATRAASYKRISRPPYLEETAKTKHDRARLPKFVAVACMAASVLCFIGGVVIGKNAFEQLPSHAQVAPARGVPAAD